MTTEILDHLADLFSGDEQDWQASALCAQTDPEAFFPEKGASTREPKRICRGCPVRAECLEYALNHDERFGIWGGLSERERRKLKKARAAHVPAEGQPAMTNWRLTDRPSQPVSERALHQ